MLSRFRATIVTLSCISQDCFGYCNCIVCLIVAFVCCIALRKLPWVTLIMLQWFGATSQRRWQWNIEQQCATGTGTQYINYHDGAYLVSLFTCAWRKELCQQEREVLMEFLSNLIKSFARSNEKQSYETNMKNVFCNCSPRQLVHFRRWRPMFFFNFFKWSPTVKKWSTTVKSEVPQ